jgi:hypothetical protein
MTPDDPPAVTRRFAELVLRAQARAAREDAEHLARLKPVHRRGPQRVSDFKTREHRRPYEA